MRKVVFIFFMVYQLCFYGCFRRSTASLSQKNGLLTHGNIQMNLIVHQTTKLEVLKNFGSPNITTRDASGLEVWTYQRSAQVSLKSNYWRSWTLIFFGESHADSKMENNSRMVTLIIKFDKQGVVCDFESRTSHF